MSTANLPALQTELAALQAQREIAQARVDIRALTEAADAPQVVNGPVSLLEDLGDFVRRDEYLYDDPTFNFGSVMVPISRLDDRLDGRYRPIFETEQQLQFIRGAAHVITALCGSAINVLINLTSYTIKDGFDHEAKVKEKAKDVPPGLVGACQHVINAAHADNDWKADLESESHWRSREDGEAAIVLRPHGWRTKMSVVEPDQITEPATPYQLEDYLAHCGEEFGSEHSQDFVPSWTFGVHTRKGEPWHPLGYHVVGDSGGRDWQYYPATDVCLARRIGSGVLELIKRNVPRNVKRGVSDFYAVVQRLERKEKLARNTEEGGAIQAAIALLREAPSTTTQSQLGNLTSGASTSQYQKPLGPGKGGTVTQLRQKFAPGTVLTSNGLQYKYGPMGQSGAPNFIAILQAAIRDVGSRWVIPEYMISSDASNANFASTLVAGSPFVAARQQDQRFYESRFKRMDWLILRIAFEGGFFETEFHGLGWQQIEQMIEISVTAPDITIGDDLKSAQVKAIERANGVLDSETWIKESGRDVDVVKANLAKEKAEQAQQQPAAQPKPGEQPGSSADTGAPVVRDEQLAGTAESLLEDFDESKHPRDDHGRFVSGARLEAAKKDPKKAAELRKQVTDPAQRKKLDAAIGKPKGDSPEIFTADDEVKPLDIDKAKAAAVKNKADQEKLAALMGNDEEPSDGDAATPKSLADILADNPDALDFHGAMAIGEIKSAGISAGRSLTKSEKSSVTHYTEAGYIGLNKGMRAGKLSPEDKVLADSLVKLIDQAGAWKKPATVFRGLDASPQHSAAFLRRMKSLIEKKGTWSEKIFTSTSLERKRALKFATQQDGDHVRVLLEIKAKSGAYLNGLSSIPDEDEVLKKPGTRYRPLAMTEKKVDGKTVVVVQAEEV